VERLELLEHWRQEEQRPFVGWDFSYIRGLIVSEHPPWSYAERAAAHMEQSSSVLDMGTGGGERFLGLRTHWPANVTVTEEYPPNLTLVQQRLGPLAVRVVDVRLTYVDPMPFEPGEFELVLNRHSAFNPAEVGRVLTQGGTFLTQQVPASFAEGLMTEFGAAPQWPESNPHNYVRWLEAAGLRIVDRREWTGELHVHDIGALVYYLKAVPWIVPGFSVDSHASTLLRLHSRLESSGSLMFKAGSYLIEARKPD